MTADALFTLEGVRKHYPIRGGIFKRQIGRVSVLNGIDLTINQGEITGLVGESGCGKSTLAKLLVKLEDPTEGVIRFNGKPLGDIRGAAKRTFYRQVQMVFQDPFSSLNPRLKVKDIVGEMIRIQGVGKPAETERVRTVLQQVGLNNDALGRYPHEFSGGQRQRIAIARALIVKPSLLIADEPVSALDLALQVKTLALLKTLKQTYDLTILLISHDLKKVATFCNRVAVMYLGRIVEEIEGNALLHQSRHPYTKALIESIPIADPTRRRQRQNIITGEVPSPVDLPPGCAFHQRCTERLEVCDRTVPALKPAGQPGHRLACFLMDLPDR